VGSDPSKNRPGNDASQPRRSFLASVALVGSAAIGLLLAVPGVAYVIDPLVRAGGKKGRWLRVAALDALGNEHPTAFPVVGALTDAWTRSERVRLGSVWLRREGDAVVALSAECPHLGCKVGYDRAQKKFACPCHESAFSAGGEVLGGPAPRALDPLETRIVGGQVEVRFVRFRAQVPERVEVG
jgi:Rieske Fe-S protein